MTASLALPRLRILDAALTRARYDRDAIADMYSAEWRLANLVLIEAVKLYSHELERVAHDWTIALPSATTTDPVVEAVRSARAA